MSVFSYFGYGSLINDATRTRGHAAHNAWVRGWRREWRVVNSVTLGSHGLTGVCSLGITPDADCIIAGIVVHEPLENLPALDEREHRYDRIVIDDGGFIPSLEQNVFVYRSLPENRVWAHDKCPILLSYVDCVLQGVLHRYGEAGMADFFHTTDGWSLPIYNDRDAPLYPRSILLAEKERVMIDHYLAVARS